MQTSDVKEPSIKTRETQHIMQRILNELQLLRSDIAMILPHEELDEYEHGDRVRQSYHNAIREHPPVGYGNRQDE